MMAQVNAGRVRFVGRGEYNNSTQYYVFDLVSYNGNSYYAKVDTIGHLPTDTTYWQLVAEKGNVGPVGPTGNGISSITKTGTSGLVDTYTITFTNGNTTTFDVTNGKGIDRIEKTATVGNIDTYTIYFNDNSTSTFEVANGEVTKEELQEEVDRLSMIYNLFPTTSDEDTEMTLDGTGEVKLKKIGLKGNTSQVVIPEEQGTSVSNTSIYVNDVNTDKENTIEMSGNTYQETTTGKNKYGITSATPQAYSNSLPIGFTNYIKIDSYDLNNVSFHSTGAQYYQVLLPTIQLEPNTDYILSYTRTNNLVTGASARRWYYTINNNNEYELGHAYNAGDSGDKTYQFTTGTTGKIAFAFGYSNQSSGSSSTVNNIMIRLATESDTYEPYTGNQPSPSPDYPQDIQVVSGDNIIKVEGQQLFQDEYIGVPSSDNINVILSAGTYTLSTCDSNNFGTNVYARLFDSSGSIITTEGHMTATSGGGSINWNFSTSSHSYYGGSNYSTITFTIDNDYQLNIGLLNSDSTRKVMLVKGSEVVRTYQPYQSASYPINLPVENLFDKDNANVLNAYISGSKVITESSNDRTIYIPCKPNTTYTIQKILAEPTAQNKFRVCTTSSVPTLGATGIDYVGYSTGVTETKITITTSSNANYLCVFMYTFTSAITTTWEQMLSSIQIEQGSKANTYWAYGTTPIELCKIGTYQDKIYKDNGKWYLNKQIGKVVLDGSEDWSYGTSGATGIISSSIQISSMLSGNYLDGLTTYFHNDKSGKAKNSMRFGANSKYIYLYLDETEYTSVNDVKTWLNTHNTDVYYVLATPTYEEITDTTLVNQLNALYNANIYPITNINTDTSNLLPYIDLHYNFVTPSPSPSRPSVVNVVTGDNTIKVEGKNLLPTSDIISTSGTISNGVTFTRNSDGSIKANGTATSAISIYINNDYTELSAGTYTFSDSVPSGESGTTFFLYADVRHTDNTIWDGYNFSTANTTTGRTQTIPEGFKFKTRIVIRSGQTLNNIVFKPMLEKGSTATTYEPYQSASYPINLGNIELCKIGDYQDDFRKSTGKNLWNLNTSYSNTGSSSAWVLTDTSFSIPAGTYTISCKNSNSTNSVRFNYKYADNTESYVRFNTSGTFTITEEVTKVAIQLNANTTITDIMLEKGNQPTSYEPYGKVWYLHKDIGKVVLDGSENWASTSSVASETSIFYYDNNEVLNSGMPSDSNIYILSNMFKRMNWVSIYSADTTTKNAISNYNNQSMANGRIVIRIDNTYASTVANFKTWLSTHNTTVYYVLATPTITEITDTTLIEQLDNLENAYSYDTQTNITQTNDDMSFILDVEALMSLKGVLN